MSLLKLALQWCMIIGVAIVLSAANIYGYTKCSKGLIVARIIARQNITTAHCFSEANKKINAANPGMSFEQGNSRRTIGPRLPLRCCCRRHCCPRHCCLYQMLCRISVLSDQCFPSQFAVGALAGMAAGNPGLMGGFANAAATRLAEQFGNFGGK